MLLMRHPWLDLFSKWLEGHQVLIQEISLPRPIGHSTLLSLTPTQKNCGDTVFFLHGLGNDLFFSNLSLFKIFLESGYQVLAIDLDGHGMHQTSVFSYKSLSSIIEDSLQALQSSAPSPQHIHLCGYSFGAALAVDTISKNPKLPIHTITTIGMPEQLHITSRFLGEALFFGQKSWYTEVQRWGLLANIPAVSVFGRKRYPVRLPSHETRSYLNVADEFLRSMDLKTNVKNIKIPHLLLYGDQDPICWQPDSAFYLSHTASLKVILKETNHFMTMYHSALSAAIIDFLQST